MENRRQYKTMLKEMRILIAKRMKNHAINLKLAAHHLTRRRNNQGMTRKNHTQEKARRWSRNAIDSTILLQIKLQVQ